MNIFYLDEDIKKCCEYHADKHVVKMILETSQLLCGVHWCSGSEAPYKLSHKNHPCSIWARSSLSNYLYLCEIGMGLCDEYTYRYGKRHKCKDIIEWCIEHKPNIEDNGFTELPKVVPDEHKKDSVVESYREYYRKEKLKMTSWKYRNKPYWF